jgi:lysophospholipase L1-like esterase
MRHVLALALLVLAVPAAALNPDKRTVVVIGDSIAAGAGADSSKRAVFHRLERMSGGDWFFLNVSRSGVTLAPGAPFPPLNPALLGLDGVIGDDVLVMLGVNDFGSNRPLADVADALDTLLARAVLWDIAVTCVTPLWLIGEETTSNVLGLGLEDYRAVIRDRCAAAGGCVIEGIDLMPHDPALFLNGRLHPNDRGYNYLARRLHTALRVRGW